MLVKGADKCCFCNILFSTLAGLTINNRSMQKQYGDILVEVNLTYIIPSVSTWHWCWIIQSKTNGIDYEGLTHWGRVMHICGSKLRIIDSDSGLSPRRRQAIMWTNAGLLLIGPLGTNFSEILIKIQNFSFTNMHLKISSAEQQLFCHGGDELVGFCLPWRRVTATCTISVWSIDKKYRRIFIFARNKFNMSRLNFPHVMNQLSSYNGAIFSVEVTILSSITS